MPTWASISTGVGGSIYSSDSLWADYSWDLVFLVEWSLGWIEITGSFSTSSGSVADESLPFAVEILGPFVVLVVLSITEELLSRGYQLRNLAEGFNFPLLGARGAVLLAWLLSSSLFGLLHVFNPNASVVSTVNLILAGLLLGLGYILTGSLAIPIGLHITWNFFMGNVFGFPVSGNDFSTATFIAIRQGGPELWTGGAFGPEAGLIGVGAMAIGALSILIWVRWWDGDLRICTELASYSMPDSQTKLIATDHNAVTTDDSTAKTKDQPQIDTDRHR